MDFKNVDWIKLATLQQLLGQGTYNEALEELTHPVLLREKHIGDLLTRLPLPLVETLAKISTEKLNTVAHQWSQTEEMQLDKWPMEECKEVIQELSELARRAVDEGTNLYLWVSP